VAFINKPEIEQFWVVEGKDLFGRKRGFVTPRGMNASPGEIYTNRVE